MGMSLKGLLMMLKTVSIIVAVIAMISIILLFFNSSKATKDLSISKLIFVAGPNCIGRLGNAASSNVQKRQNIFGELVIDSEENLKTATVICPTMKFIGEFQCRWRNYTSQKFYMDSSIVHI